jgi:hypothetical protein
MKFVFVELDDQPITNRKGEKSQAELPTPPRAKFKSVIIEEQTIASILLSSESSS